MKNIALLIQSETLRTSVLPDYTYGESVGIPMYALAHTDLAQFACLLITNHADQRELMQCKAQLQAYVEQGGKLVFNGHVVYPFLNELQPYQPTPETGLAGLQVLPREVHPIFAGIEGHDLTYRRGVAGFYGRGYNPAPANALVLTELGTTARLPIDWLYEYPQGGQLLVHAGNDFLSFSNAPSTSGMRTAFYRWVASDTNLAVPPPHTASPAAPLARLCFVENGTYFHHRTLHTPEFTPYFHTTRHVLDLDEQDFAQADTMVFCCNTRAELIARHKDAIAHFLDQGKTVVAMGNTGPEQWLPNIDWQDCPVNFWWWKEANPDSGLRMQWPDHSLFKHITLADATWHQHGTFQVPTGARSLIDKEGLGSVLYEDTATTPGRLIITSLDPFYHHGSYFMPSTTRFLRGFLPWLERYTRPLPKHAASAQHS